MFPKELDPLQDWRGIHFLMQGLQRCFGLAPKASQLARVRDSDLCSALVALKARLGIQAIEAYGNPDIATLAAE